MPWSCRALQIHKGSSVNAAADPALGPLATLKIRPQVHDKTNEIHSPGCGSLFVPAILVLCLVLQVVLVVHAIPRHRRDGWLLLILMLPGVGALAYLLLTIWDTVLQGKRRKRGRTYFPLAENKCVPFSVRPLFRENKCVPFSAFSAFRRSPRSTRDAAVNGTHEWP